jgi:hypothetical protein
MSEALTSSQTAPALWEQSLKAMPDQDNQLRSPLVVPPSTSSVTGRANCALLGFPATKTFLAMNAQMNWQRKRQKLDKRETAHSQLQTTARSLPPDAVAETTQSSNGTDVGTTQPTLIDGGDFARSISQISPSIHPEACVNSRGEWQASSHSFALDTPSSEATAEGSERHQTAQMPDAPAV